MDEPRIEVTKDSRFILLPLDDDGTPMAGGERMVEVSPGMWKSPTLIQIEEYLAKHMPIIKGNEEERDAATGDQGV